MKKRQLIITIDRECGSGAHEIGEILADYYGIKLYDDNIIDVLAERFGLDRGKAAKLDERVTGQLIPAAKNGFAKQYGTLMNSFTESDRLFLMEKGLIQTLAETESFVIIGRAANTILAGHPNMFRLFVYAPEEFKLPRVKEHYNLDTDTEAVRRMRKVDKARRDYFQYYSDKTWGYGDAYDLTLDTSMLGIGGTADMILEIMNKRNSGNVLYMPGMMKTAL